MLSIGAGRKLSSHPKRAGDVDDDDGEDEWLEVPVHVERLGTRSDKVLVGFLVRW